MSCQFDLCWFHYFSRIESNSILGHMGIARAPTKLRKTCIFLWHVHVRLWSYQCPIRKRRLDCECRNKSSLHFGERLCHCVSQLTFTTLWAHSPYFVSSKIGFDISYKLSPEETICMKCQILFLGKDKESFKLSSAKFLPSMLSVNRVCLLHNNASLCREKPTVCIVLNKHE